MNYSDKLPRDWASVELGEIVQPIRPRHNPRDFPELPFIGLEHLEPHTMKLLGTVPAKTMRSNAIHFQPCDLLYGRLRPYLNKVYRPDFEGLCSAEFIVLPPSRYIDQRYLQYLLNSWDFVTFASHLNEGDRPRVDFAQIATYPVPLPPLPEQYRIVAKIEELFSRLDAGVEALRRAQGLLKLYRVAILEAAVIGRLNATGVDKAMLSQENQESGTELLSRILAERRRLWYEQKNRQSYRYREPISPVITNLPELPPKWTWATLDQLLLTLRNGISEPPHGDGGLPVLRISAVRPMFLDTSDVRFFENPPSSYYDFVVEPGDLLFTRYNGNPSLVGVCAMVKKVPGTIVYPDKIIRGKVVSGSLVLPDYLEIALNVGYSRRFIWDRARTTAGQTGISGADLRQTPVPLPPLIEQQRIVCEIQRHYSVLDYQEKVCDSSLIASKRLRQRILEKAFSGRLIPQDPSDEPASKLLERIRAERARMEAEQPRRRKRRAN